MNTTLKIEDIKGFLHRSIRSGKFNGLACKELQHPFASGIHYPVESAIMFAKFDGKNYAVIITPIAIDSAKDDPSNKISSDRVCDIEIHLVDRFLIAGNVTSLTPTK